MNNNIEILDIYEQEKLELKKFYDKLLFNITYVVGILLPIFFFVFIVSLNSNVLIRKKKYEKYAFVSEVILSEKC